jgi:hypothetical protein
MVTVGAGELIAEDDLNKRYTVREKKTGKLMTFYWDAKANAPKSVEGDFSAIPADREAAAPGNRPGANCRP